MEMLPDGHTYEEGVTYSSSFTSSDVPDGEYDAKFWFADDDIEAYPSPQITLPITVGSGGSSCEPAGDLNSDGLTNVLDIVLSVSFALGNSVPGTDQFFATDINSDGEIDILDIVSIVNLILE